MMLRSFGLFLFLAAITGVHPSLQAAPAFSVPGFVDEELYKGNGMISLQFDSSNRLWVTEKNGRVLVFEPNETQATSFTYEYFEKDPAAPEWKNLPDFAALKPVETGTVPNFTLQPKHRGDNYAFRYRGPISIPQNGSYTFYLASDDGSRLYVDDQLVVDHDGLHPPREKSGSATLTAGPHQVRVEYFNRDGGQSLEVLWEGPGLAKGPLASGLFKAPKVFADFSKQVNPDSERGLLGLALDPAFAQNHFLYILFTTDKDQRILRLTANADFTAMVPGSEIILLSGLPNLNGNHKAGDIAFHPKDPQNLYVMVGDDGDRNKVADLDNYWGKLLKIRASDGKGLASNPYFDGNEDSVRSRIWTKGYRNPFRFAFDPEAPLPDVIYVSENGDGRDRLVRIEKGAIGGWPEAFEKSSEDGKRTVLQISDPSKTAIAIIRGGPLGKDGPILYNARYGGGDRSEVRRWKLTGPNLDKLEELPEDKGNAFYKGYTDYNIVSFRLGPDGALYYTDSNQGDSLGDGYRLGRLRFVKGATPVADFSATPTIGPAPLEVAFTDSSTSPEGSITSWDWDFGDGTTSREKNPKHRYPQPGNYVATLKTANASGLNSSKQVPVKVVYQTQLKLYPSVFDARTSTPQIPGAPVELRVYLQDGTTPLAFTGGKGAGQNVLPLPSGGAGVMLPLEITEPGIVLSAGEGGSTGLQPAFIGIPLSFSAPQQTAAPVFQLSNTLIRGRVLDTKHRPVQVDLGLSKDREGNYFNFVGGILADPASGAAKGTGPRLEPDGLGYYNIPIPDGTGSAPFFFDTGVHKLTATHGKVKQRFQVYQGKTTLQNLTIGLYDGGTDEADLSKIPVTPGVDFEKQIQPILTFSCVACHNGIATNTGGLDLQPGKSLQFLINRESTQAPGIKLVDPGSPEHSYLMEKINSKVPQSGTNMRPGDPMNLEQRALIRDWIQQLKTEEPKAP